jgi:alpha-L-fucosidase
MELDRPALDMPALDVPEPISSSNIKKTSASNVYEEDKTEFGPQQAFDNDAQTRWATDRGTKQAWITAAFGTPMTVESIRIGEAEPYTARVTKFEFQYRDGEAWKTIFSGTKIGGQFQQKFPPVNAQEFRLNILEATEGPTIADIELLLK